MLELEQKLLENEIRALISSYQYSINEELTNFLFAKSKRIRSTLVFLFAKSLNLKLDESIIKLAAAVELLHAATLFHDDVIDNAKIRRGIETFNSKYDSKYAVLIGDLILTMVNSELLQLNNPKIFNIFSSAMTNLCLGELKQYSQRGSIPTFQEYIEKSKSKTSSLFIAALNSLGILLNQDKVCSALVNFAINFGIAFQIKDDLTNFACSDDLKPTMTDFENGIYSAPVLFYIQKGEKLRYFPYAFRNNEKLKNELIEKTCEMIKEYSDKAILSLRVLYDNQYKKDIENLCNLLWRIE